MMLERVLRSIVQVNMVEIMSSFFLHRALCLMKNYPNVVIVK